MGGTMIESKGWQWESVTEDESNVWKNPSIESYYLLNRWKSQDKIEFLDLGCGLGRHSILFGKNGFAVRCFDISEEAIRRTKDWAEQEGLTFDYRTDDMLMLPYDNKSVDCILCQNVISHTDTYGVKKAISEVKRVLKADGECYLTLGSKETWGFKQEDWPLIDNNTKLCMKEGPEYQVPHFYADYNLVKELFADFNIISITHIEDFYENKGKIYSSFHYHVLVKKENKI